MINILNNPMFTMGILNYLTQLLRISKKIMWPHRLQLELAQYFLLPCLFCMESMDRTKLSFQTMFNIWSTTYNYVEQVQQRSSICKMVSYPFLFFSFLSESKCGKKFSKIGKSFPRKQGICDIKLSFTFCFHIWSLQIHDRILKNWKSQAKWWFWDFKMWKYSFIKKFCCFWFFSSNFVR